MIETHQNQAPLRTNMRKTSILKKSTVVKGKISRSKSEISKSVGFVETKLRTVIEFEPFIHEKEYLKRTHEFRKMDKKNKGCSCLVF
jgi:hypothetical protein